MRVGIIGAGISGLVVAYRIRQRRPDWSLQIWEREEVAGGVIQTDRQGDRHLELGADSFLVTEKFSAAEQLCSDLGLSDRLVPTSQQNRRVLVAFQGKLLPIPDGFQLMSPGDQRAIVRSRLLSWEGKWRLWRERWVPRRFPDREETLAQFATRRLGPEVFERMVEPLVAGIYTGDADRLSVDATLSQFVAQEREYGSLTEAALHAHEGTESGARYARFQAPRDGMAKIIERLVETIGAHHVAYRYRVEQVRRTAAGAWCVTGRDGSGHGWEANEIDRLVIAGPAPSAARLLAGDQPTLARQVAQIESADSAVAHLTYRRDQIEHPLDAFGIVVPRTESVPLLAASFSSIKFPHRCPASHVMIRAFLGGALHADSLVEDDAKLTEMAHAQLATMLAIRGRPDDARMQRWQGKMPQYHLGHQARVAAIEQELKMLSGLHLAGNYLHGVGLPQCIAQANRVANEITGESVCHVS